MTNARGLGVRLLAMTVVLLLCAACASDEEPVNPSSEEASLSASPADETSSLEPPKIRQPALPKIQSLKDAGAVTMPASKSIDWTIVAYDKVWIAGVGKGIGIFDAT